MKLPVSLLACFVVSLLNCGQGESLTPAEEVVNAIAALQKANGNNGSSCHLSASDFVFVLDESGSIGINNFKLALQFIANLTQALDIGPGDDKSRVGMVEFDDSAYISFNLSTYMTNAAVYNAILTQGYTGGGTNIAAGMNKAIDYIFTNAGGWRPSLPHIMIVLTDGGDSSDVVTANQHAQAKNITTFAIGIGSGINYAELLKVVGGDPSHVYNVSSFSGLNSFLPTLCNDLSSNKPRECQCTPQNIYLDIVIAVDSSDGMGEGFRFTIELLADIVGHMTVNQTLGVRTSRIGLINFANTVQVVGDLTAYQSSKDASNALKNMQKIGGPSVNLEAVIANASYLFASSGNRPNIKNVLLLLTSASARCPSDPACRPADDLKLSGVTIATIAMGFEDAPPLIDLGSDCNRLDNKGMLAKTILNVFCQANCYCPQHYTQFIDSQVNCRKYGECILAGPNGKETWDGAQGTCQQTTTGLKGFIADALSAEKEAFLKKMAIQNNAIPFWLGLNDKAKSGTYVWDRGTDPPLQAGKSDYKNYASGMPNEGANGMQCIMDQTIGGFKLAWQNALCDDIFGNTVINVMCQTIAYDTDNVPGTL